MQLSSIYENSLKSRLLRIAGAAVFFILLVAAVLFIKGYQFDVVSKDLVKKSVIFFEGGIGQRTVTIDGKLSPSVGSELRLSHGVHTIVLEQEGFLPWKKQIALEEDELVRIKTPLLLPRDFSSTTFPHDAAWQLQQQMQQDFFFYNKHLQVAKRVRSENNVPLRVIEILIPFMPSVLVPFEGSDTQFVGIDTEGFLFFYELNARDVFYTKRSFVALQMVAVQQGIFLKNKTGEVYTLTQFKNEPQFLFRLPDPIVRIKTATFSQDYGLFVVDTQASQKASLQHVLVLVDLKTGAVIYADTAQAGFIEAQMLWYVQNDAIMNYDLIAKKRKRVGTTTIPQITFARRVGESNRIFFVTSNFVPMLCDDDGTQCIDLGSPLDSADVFPFAENTIFVGKISGKDAIFDFRQQSSLQKFLKNLIS